mmetsp:Transcript_11818/g.28865  ORF Transcript_11818/g.28865 Transcript_11818/m.28865 type:complete len:543 (+) Transcript_11818:3-1631(+)
MWSEWLAVYSQPAQSDKAYASFMVMLQQQGWLKAAEPCDHFFRVIVEIAVESAAAGGDGDKGEGASSKEGGDGGAGRGALNFRSLDALSKLVAILVRYFSDAGASNTRLTLLHRALAAVLRVLLFQYDHEPSKFNQRIYFRLLGNWLFDLNAPDPVLDSINFQVLTAFANALHALQPARLPAFAFAWLELASHRMLMPKLLLAKGHKGWVLFQRLLVHLCRFLYPFLNSANLTEPVRLLYRGLLRVLLVLLHDFPEFLCEYHFALCDVIPPTCVQMRNIVLSAFPRNMRLPDPFMPNLKVDLLPEITQPPRLLSSVSAALDSAGLRPDVDSYLKNRAPYTMLLELRQRLLLPEAEASAAGSRYNVPLLNSLVLHVGTQAIAQLQTKGPQVASPISNSAPMDIFQQLVGELDSEGRYLLLNALANQLRYPNNHTHYFSCVILGLFHEAGSDQIQEQITRVLVERLIVHRPHPWGLLITFIELIKNPRYSFWAKPFIRAAPEIEKLFESVSRSCMGPAPSPSGQGASGADEASSAATPFSLAQE